MERRAPLPRLRSGLPPVAGPGSFRPPGGAWGGHRLGQDNSTRRCQGRWLPEVACAAVAAARRWLTYRGGPSERG